MRNKFWIPALACAVVLPAHADYLFKTDFESGAIPASMTVADNDGQEIGQTSYKNGATPNGWTVSQVLGGGYAAVSPTHSGVDEPQSNILSLPSLKIAGTRPMLRWRARSIHPGLLDAYRVTIREAGTYAAETLSDIPAESFRWTDYAVDLSAWKGKEVVVSFECVSVNKYLLAIDDISVGDPEDVSFAGESTSPEFAGLAWDFPGKTNGTARVAGHVLNTGMPLSGGRIVCLADGNVVDSKALPAVFACGDRVDYEFALPVSLDASAPYAIAVEDASGKRTSVIESRVRASHFARVHVATEYTGLWCNNCPAAGIELEELEYRFGPQMVKLVGHIQTANNDMFECADYRAETYAGQYFSIPRMVLNHKKSTNAANCSKFADEYDTPTPVGLEVCDYKIEDRTITAEVGVTWAESLDNTDDRYRLGYVLTRSVDPVGKGYTFRQSNSTSAVKSDRYYYLPTSVRAELTTNTDYVCWGANSGKGWAGSLKHSFESMKPVGAELQIEFPAPEDPGSAAAVNDLSETRLVVYVIDTRDGSIVNACFQNLNEACNPEHTPEEYIDPNPDPGPDPEPETDTATLSVFSPEYAAKGLCEVTAVIESTSESGLDNWTVFLDHSMVNGSISGDFIPYGETETVTFDVPIFTDEDNEYGLILTADHLEEQVTFYGTIKGLDFIPRHRILLEQKASTAEGLTPAAMYIVERMGADASLRERVIPVSLFAERPLALDDYAPEWTEPAPCFRVDRDGKTLPVSAADALYEPETEGSAVAGILGCLDEVAPADFSLEACYILDGGKVTAIDASTVIIPVRTLQGSDYTISFLLTENNVCEAGLTQANALSSLTTLSADNAFGQLPATISGMYFQDVLRAVYDYSGIPGSVPARELLPSKRVNYHTTLSLPESVGDTRNLSLTALLLDSHSGRVVNSARVALSDDAQPKVTSADILSASGIGDVSLPDAPAEYFNLQGIRIPRPASGLCLERRGNRVSKVMIR